jgi:HNH endonuclease
MERLHAQVRRRAANRCEYCKMPQKCDLLPFHLDHVIARQHGGSNAPNNLAWACLACNNHKGPNIAGLDRETGEIVRLFHPRNDLWSDHFVWRGSELFGLTAIGRVTIHVLAINLRYRREVREALMVEGEFPPP